MPPRILSLNVVRKAWVGLEKKGMGARAEQALSRRALPAHTGKADTPVSSGSSRGQETPSKANQSFRMFSPDTPNPEYTQERYNSELR